MPDCLVIDDETSIADTICEYFNLFGVSCESAGCYEDGYAAVVEKRPSLVLLDINLGGQSGFELCKNLRAVSDVPIIFISARGSDDDVLAAFGIGGDEFVAKPFSMAVLLAKARAMLKRSDAAQANVRAAGSGGAGPPKNGCNIGPDDVRPQENERVFRFGGAAVDERSGRVTFNGEPVRLKPLEYKLLLYFCKNAGRRLVKEELLEKVWGDTFVGEGTLSVHIRHLREKLESDPGNPQYIKTLWGSGYIFEISTEQ